MAVKTTLEDSLLLSQNDAWTRLVPFIGNKMVFLSVGPACSPEDLEAELGQVDFLHD